MQASLNIFHKNVKVRSHKFVRNNLLTLHTKMYSTSNTLESTSDTVKRMKMADLAGPGKSTYEQVKKVLPKNYSAVLNHRETQVAINTIKTTLKDSLCRNLNLQEIAVPLIVSSSSGVNDYLDRDSSRMPVSLTINNDGEHPVQAEVVQAATKWKRLALKQFKFGLGEGLITDMKAIRSGYFLDHDHSATVGQFDWEQTIHRSQRNIDYLKHIVRKIYDALTDAEFAIRLKFPDIVKAFPQPILHEEITFLHAEELLAKYPNLSRKERETAILKEHKAVFLIGIGWTLDDGYPHELRAADYDDWATPNGVKDAADREYHGLNGDFLVWNPTTQRRHELSSMGVRVDAKELAKQLEITKQTDFARLPYHREILNGEIPSAIGGGIGLERTYMLLLAKAHIGEVSVTPWPDVMYDMCDELNIPILK